MASSSSSNHDACNTEQELQTLWSTSFDGWVDVPRHPPGVVYLRPAKEDEASLASSNESIPSVVRDCTGGIFALTAFNPMGQDTPLAENRAANQRLAEELQARMQPPPLHIWQAFGFAQDWREDGFVVAFGGTERTGEQAVRDLADKYRQGAIYEFVPILNGDSIVGLRRKTIPVEMEHVEADVIVVPCKKPDVANAELTIS